MLDVVVIGSGPAGSQAAYGLARSGAQVVVLEKKPGIESKPCTGIISQECVNYFSIPDNVIFRKVNSARMHSPSGNVIRLHRQENQACIIDRKAFDEHLAKRAQGEGAEYRFSSKAIRVVPEKDRVQIQVEKAGERTFLYARAAVLSSGFNSPLVRDVGSGSPSYFATGAQAEVKVNGIDEVEVYFSQKIAPGFFGWLVPTAEGKGLVGLMGRKSPGLLLRGLIRKLREEGKILPGECRIRYAGIPLKTLSRTYSERIVVVGDAAGQVKPTTGGGIYFGMLCADVAVQNLLGGMKTGDLSARRLSQYQKDWHKKLKSELRREYCARWIYTHLSDKQVNRIFSALSSNGIIDSLLQDGSLSFDWHGGLLLKAFRMGAAAQIRRWLPIGRK